MTATSAAAVDIPCRPAGGSALPERLAGVRWRLLVTDGAPALELERIAGEAGADLLVLARSDRGLVHRLFSASVGGHAATHAPVPVLVIR